MYRLRAAKLLLLAVVRVRVLDTWVPPWMDAVADRISEPLLAGKTTDLDAPGAAVGALMLSWPQARGPGPSPSARPTRRQKSQSQRRPARSRRRKSPSRRTRPQSYSAESSSRSSTPRPSGGARLTARLPASEVSVTLASV